MIGEIGESRIIEKGLRDVALRITSDMEMQKDLVQEMLLHLLQVQREQPGQTFRWYVKSCEFHARNYLRLGKSVDSYKRAGGRISFSQTEAGDGEGFCHEQFFYRVDTMESTDDSKDFLRDEIFSLIAPRLSERQRQIMQMLIQGCGVREVGRQLGITHPAVIKHRRKIARIAKSCLERPDANNGDSKTV